MYFKAVVKLQSAQTQTTRDAHGVNVVEDSMPGRDNQKVAGGDFNVALQRAGGEIFHSAQENRPPPTMTDSAHIPHLRILNRDNCSEI